MTINIKYLSAKKENIRPDEKNLFFPIAMQFSSSFYWFDYRIAIIVLDLLIFFPNLIGFNLPYSLASSGVSSGDG